MRREGDESSPYVASLYSLERCVLWTMRSLDDASLGRSLTWSMYPLDDASLERSVTWTLYPLDDASLYALTLTGDWGEMDAVIIRSEHIGQGCNASSKGCIVQRTHHPRGVSSKRQIV